MSRFALFTFLLLFKQSVCNPPSFVKFSLSDTPIKVLNEQTFISNNTYIKNIVLVKLINCQISEVSPASFQQMNYLRFVSLAHNQIKEIPASLFEHNRLIKTINFGNNEIVTVQDGIFSNLKLLESITLTHNKIVRVESNVFKDLTMLKALDLSSNHLKIMSPDMFKSNINLQKIQLEGNKIDQIDDKLFSPLIHLIYLDLNRNQINETHVNAFSQLRSLVMLNFEHNYIKNFEVGSFDNNIELRVLNLNENDLEKIENGLFTKLIKLEYLNLKANYIRTVGDSVFPESQNLATISLCRNQLMVLNPKTFEKVYGLKHLCVADNPWYCDCNLKGFHSYYINNKNITKETIICYQPEKISLKSWSEIISSELVCDDSKLVRDAEDIILPLTLDSNTKIHEFTQSPPPLELNISTEKDYENEEITMEKIKQEEKRIEDTHFDLHTSGSHADHHANRMAHYELKVDDYDYHTMNDDHIMNDGHIMNNDHIMQDDLTKLPDCFHNTANYDEQYNKNFIQWRARLLGEFLITSSAKHRTSYPNNDIYKRTGSAMLVPNHDGFTFSDPSLSEMDWKHINNYLQEICSITDDALHGSSKNMVKDYVALQEVSKFIDSLNYVVKEKLRYAPHDNYEIGTSEHDQSNRNNAAHFEMPNVDQYQQAHLVNLHSPNHTDGKNIFYYIINATAEGHGYININTN